MSEIFLLNLIVVIGSFTILWVVSISLHDVSIIDIFWGGGFVVVAWVTALWTENPSSVKWLLTVLVTVWGLRLAGYLACRNFGHEEDKRYAKMRAARGQSFWWKSYFVVFLLQAVILWVVSLPLQVGILNASSKHNFLHYLGMFVWLIGFGFEAIGDAQLATFKRKPENRGRVLQRGLWRYTRHPNYFGDFVVWWGFYLICIANGSGYWTILSPLIMSVFLMFVSGVAMTEKSMKSEKPAYADYMRRTNIFFPGPPKQSS